MRSIRRRPLAAGLLGLALAAPLVIAPAVVPTASAADSTPIRINEVVTNGEAFDWVEIVNTGMTPADISGFVIRDSDDSHAFVIGDGAVIEAGGFVVFDVNDDAVADSFGLGKADSARLFDGEELVDSFSWTAHGSPSWARVPDGTGEFVLSAASTKGATNVGGPVEPEPEPEPPVLSDATVRINEIESNGDARGDWVELINTGDAPVDIQGWGLLDSDPSHALVPIAASTVIPAGGLIALVENTHFSFGLGGTDSARLFDASGALVDEHNWAGHAATTLARCPDGTGAFVVSTTSTFEAANDCRPSIRINEIESKDAADGPDWVELINVGTVAADASGLIFKDAKDDEPYAIPAGSIIPAGGYLVLKGEEGSGFPFGLGSDDSARLLTADGVTVDSYSWASHAATTYGRCPDGTGDFADTSEPTPGAANICAGDVPGAAWPGGASVSTADVGGFFGEDMSGLAFEGDTLWAVNNGTGVLFSLAWNGSAWAPAPTDGWAAGAALRYPDGTGQPDAEGVALTAAGSAGGVYVATERNDAASGVSRPSVLRYDVAGVSAGALTATHEWNLAADLPVVGANGGLEGIAWVPDSVLVAGGFVDENTNAPYVPSSYPGHGDGLFFVGVEQTGGVYAYALSDGGYTRITTIDSGFSMVAELEFDPASGALWVGCDEVCGGETAVFELGASGVWEATVVYERPAGLPNIANEGFAFSASCVDGVRTVVWADDSATGGNALRTGTLDCAGGAPGDGDGSGDGDGDGSDDGGDGTTPGTTTPTPADPTELNDATRGSVSAPTHANPGQTVTITVGTVHAGERVNVWLHSTPMFLGTHTVSAAGTVAVTIPASAQSGAHRLVVLAADGSVIGWSAITIGALVLTGGDPMPAALFAFALLLAGATLTVVRMRRAAAA